MAIRNWAFSLAAICAVSSVSARAEQIAVEGVYAARTDGALGKTEIAIEPIRGHEGFALENALAEQLASARIHGTPYFRLVPATFGENAEAAKLRGYASSRVYDVPDGEIKQTRCVRKVKRDDGSKECVESVTDVFECRSLQVEFRPEVELVAHGSTLYTRQDSFANSERYCADSSYIPSAEAMLDNMIARFARQVRLDLAPEQRFERIRILESRKGLSGNDRKAFKQAIKLTKSDPTGACTMFEDILVRNPFQRSALYNVALCREAAGELELAGDSYAQLVLVSDKSRFRSGMARVNSRFRAREQLAFLGASRLSLASGDTLQLGK